MAVVSWQLAWRQRGTAQRLPLSPWWPTLTLVWVVVQGLFGKYTVTLKLYPAIVTLHLLGGLMLLALLAVQHAAFSRATLRQQPVALSTGLRYATVAVLVCLGLQMALGGWVSTNYAVLACTGFPACNGQWWPAMDFGAGFVLLRELGMAGHGGSLPFEALVAIHMAHRLFAVLAAGAALLLAWVLWRQESPVLRRFGAGLALLVLAQLASGLSNVVMGWPLVAALCHSAGAAALVLLLTLLLARAASPHLVCTPAAQALPT
jgi:cytochrome c oxidase assembly protein subunit 15